MKRIVSVLIIAALMVGFIGIHLYKINSFEREASEICGEIYTEFYDENWDNIRELVAQLDEVWYKNRLWASVTLKTDVIDEIEISLMQCTEYSKIAARENFIGEFKMFCMLIEHLPKQEKPSLGELL